MPLVLSLFLISPFAFARGYDISSIEDVYRAVRSGAVTSVDELWLNLASEMHQVPALTFAGQSSVPSSSRFPRILLATDDARLFAAAPTEAGHPAYGQLEFAAADPATDLLSLYSVDYRRSPVIKRNPTECLGCHMVNGLIRLRVEGYPHWPGWYGTMGEHESSMSYDLNEREYAAVAEFFQSPRPPRLLRPYRNGFEFQDDTHLAATRLTTLATLAQARQAARVLALGPDFERLRVAFATSEFPREFSDALDPVLRAEYASAVPALAERLARDQAAYEVALTKQFKSLGERGRRTFNGHPVLFAIPLEFALNRAGSSIADFSTSATPGAVNINSGVDGNLSHYVGHALAERLARDLNLPAEDEADQRYVSGVPFPRLRRLDRKLVAPMHAKLCGLALTPAARRSH